MSERLAIWLYGKRLATVELERRRMRLRYTQEAIESFPSDGERGAHPPGGRTNRVSFDHLLNETATWGLSRARAADIVVDLLARLPDAVERAALETPEVPGEILDLIAAQLDRLQPA
jgi:hypothetical protein